MIRVEQLCKRFMMYQRPVDRLWDWVTPSRLQRGQPFWALREITFTVARGSSMGIVGINGAGKSTLLKILTGTTLATSGTFQVEGRISSLLELGTGFHPEFTGRQNIVFGARMAGLSDEELAGKFDAIVDFSELGPFIDQPVRTYSSGMTLRLGFALASSVDPDVLIIDEALSVGDMHFQQKCLRRIREFHERGVTVLFVSHDPSMVKTFCTEAILLDAGRLLDRGSPDRVLDYYNALLAEKYREGGARARIIRPDAGRPESPLDKSATPGEDEGENENENLAPSAAPAGIPVRAATPTAPGAPAPWTAPPLACAGHRTGNFQAVITSVYLVGEGYQGNPNVLVTGTRATIVVRWVALEPVASATVGIALKDRLGQDVFGVNTWYRDREIGPVAPGQVVEVGFHMPLNLGDGCYTVTAAVHSGDNHTEQCYDWAEQAALFQILPRPTERFTGLCRLEPTISIVSAPATPPELTFARQTRDSLAGVLK